MGGCRNAAPFLFVRRKGAREEAFAGSELIVVSEAQDAGWSAVGACSAIQAADA